MSDEQEREMEKLIDEVVEEADKEEEGTITLSNGVIVQPLPLPTHLIRLLYQKHRRPKPPQQKIESGGKTWWEPNPSHPDYQQAMTDYIVTVSDAMENLIALRGFEIISLPDGMDSYEEDATWEEEVGLLGFDLPKSDNLRRVMWMRYRILETEGDTAAVQSASTRLSGIEVSEEEVEAAMEGFRR